ncbi:HIT domain-containing protein [bacterium]|nr:HIT domain-containing protein [bacterium]MCI0602560.1 HIT domain-containing protein [bacterium]
MNSILSPWRFDYVTGATQKGGCVFCLAIENTDHPDSLIIHQAKHNFVLLNRYPYNNGHMMIAPYKHLSNPVEVEPEILEEMMGLFQRGIQALRAVYRPDGFNMGMNLGKCAGAGIEEHYHLHLVPRWNGDTSFMSTLAETRVIPEDFSITLTKLRPLF